MNLLLLAIIVVCGVKGTGLGRLARPKEPGFYEMSLNKNGLEYRKILPKNTLNGDLNLPGNNREITAFDFRLLSNSSQTKYVLNSDMCGDSYALTVTDSVGVAAYLNTMDSPQAVNEVVSVAYEVACEGCRDYKGQIICQQGCYGGLPDLVFEYILERGFVSHSCIPKHQSACPTVCDDGSEIQFHENDGLSVTSAFNVDPSLLRSLLTSSGPCVAEMYVHGNFATYTGGIYKRPVGSQQEESYMNHAVVIYGFGVEDGEPYWIGKNLWGAWWGEEGYFRIEMGKNDSGIEELFLCPNNNVGKGPYAAVPLPPQPQWCFDLSGPCPPPSKDTHPNRWWLVTVVVVPVVVVLVVVVIVIVVVVVIVRRRRRRTGGTRGGGRLGSVESDGTQQQQQQSVDGSSSSSGSDDIGEYRPSELLGEGQSVEETTVFEGL